MGTSHRQAPVKQVVGAVRAGLRDLFGLPDGWEVVLGNGGTTVFWDVASFGLVEQRSAHLVFGEFSSKFAEVCAAAPHLGEPHVTKSDPGDHPEAIAVDGVDLYALTHNETSTGVAMELQPAGRDRRRPRRRRRHLGCRRACRGSRPQVDVYYFAPQKCFAVRRRAVGRRLLAGRRRAHRAPRRLRPLAPGVARPRDRPDEQPPRPDVQHAGRRHPAAARRPAAVDERLGWPRLVREAQPGVVGPPLRVGRGAGVGDAVRRRPGEALGRRRHDRPRRRRSSPTRSAPRCVPTGSSTPTATASSAATSCASACSRPSSRPTSRPSRRASTTSSSTTPTRSRRRVRPMTVDEVLALDVDELAPLQSPGPADRADRLVRRRRRGHRGARRAHRRRAHGRGDRRRPVLRLHPGAPNRRARRRRDPPGVVAGERLQGRAHRRRPRPRRAQRRRAPSRLAAVHRVLPADRRALATARPSSRSGRPPTPSRTPGCRRSSAAPPMPSWPVASPSRRRPTRGSPG